MRRLSNVTIIDLVVLSVLSLVGIAGFETSFGGLGFLIAAVAGIVVGTVAAVLGTVLRLGVLTTVLIAIVAYFLLGTPFTMPDAALFVVLPSLESLAGLAIGAVFGWADILTIGTPVQAPAYIAVVPYFAAWLVSLAGSMLVLRWLPRRRTVLRASLLLIGPALLYISGILLGTDQAYLAGVRGVAFAVIALTWLAWRRGSVVEAQGDGANRLRNRRIQGSAVVVAGAVVIGAVSGFALAPTQTERFVLRDQVVPPFDTTEYPSPLAGFRGYTKTKADETLFTVTGMQPGDTVRLATMDAFDGQLYNIAGPDGRAADGGYAITGETLPEPPLATLDGERTIGVEIDAYSDVWLPTVGYGSDLRLGGDASERSGELRYNATAGTAVLKGGVNRGVEYRLEAAVQREPDDAELASTPVAEVELAAVDDAPDVIAAKAKELAGDSSSPIEQLRAIEKGLATEGFLSHGLASDEAPSRAGHGADRLIELFTRSEMIGDDEQYASAMALMARSLGYPARVVLGFAPEIDEGASSIEVLGSDVSAWVEVPFEDVGWVGFRPTPERTDAPKLESPKSKTVPQPQVRQPPRAEHAADELLSTTQIDDSEDKRKKQRQFEVPTWVWIAASSVAVPLAIIFLPMLLVLARKRGRRRRRRRTLDDRSAAGAWEELLDRSSELGVEPPGGASRRQAAREIERQLAAQGLDVRIDGTPVSFTTLAATIDRDVFAGDDIVPATAERRWTEVDAIVDAMERVAGGMRRFVARYRFVERGRAPRRRSR
jgi:transglutaminase-like putative cysteine protease